MHITKVTPGTPGQLKIHYSDESTNIVKIADAPNSSDVVLESPLLSGESVAKCPHCSAFMSELYKYNYYSKVIKNKVYSYDSSEFQEVFLAFKCFSCAVPIFNWEINSMYIEYIQFGKKIINGLRLEPVTKIPGKCDGIRKVAFKDSEFDCLCAGFPKCLETKTCEEDWQIEVKASKIPLKKLTSLYLLKKYLKND